MIGWTPAKLCPGGQPGEGGAEATRAALGPGLPPGRCGRATVGVGEATGPALSLTLARLVSRDALRAQPLVHDVQHLPAQVEDEQRQRPQRHGGRAGGQQEAPAGVPRRREGRRVVAKATGDGFRSREAGFPEARALPGWPEGQTRETGGEELTKANRLRRGWSPFPPRPAPSAPAQVP